MSAKQKLIGRTLLMLKSLEELEPVERLEFHVRQAQERLVRMQEHLNDRLAEERELREQLAYLETLP